jgi:XPG I-region
MGGYTTRQIFLEIIDRWQLPLAILDMLINFLIGRDTSIHALIDMAQKRQLPGPSTELTIALDVSVYLYYFSHRYRQGIDSDFNGAVRGVCDDLMAHLQRRFISAGMKLSHIILVFDGDRTHRTDKMRHVSGTSSQFRLTSKFVDAVRVELMRRECNTMVAKGEADHQLASLSKEENIHVVMTSDNDIIVHGARTCLFSKVNGSFKLFTPSKAMQLWLLIIPSLNGCDYGTGVRNAGKATIAKVIIQAIFRLQQEFNNLEVALSEVSNLMRMFGVSKKILLGFATQQVYVFNRGRECKQYQFLDPREMDHLLNTLNGDDEMTDDAKQLVQHVPKLLESWNRKNATALQIVRSSST